MVKVPLSPVKMVASRAGVSGVSSANHVIGYLLVYGLVSGGLGSQRPPAGLCSIRSATMREAMRVMGTPTPGWV